MPHHLGLTVRFDEMLTKLWQKIFRENTQSDDFTEFLSKNGESMYVYYRNFQAFQFTNVQKRVIHCHANLFPSNQFAVRFFGKTLI